MGKGNKSQPDIPQRRRHQRRVPKQSAGFGVLCKISSAEKDREAEEDDEKGKYHRIAPAGFEHDESKKQGGKGHNQRRKEQSF